MSSATGYSKGTGAKELRRLPAMTLTTVRQLQAAERTAKDAFYAQHASEAKPGHKPSAKYTKLQAAMVAATKARQTAMTEYAATLVG